jgi:hypothetical protein
MEIMKKLNMVLLGYMVTQAIPKSIVSIPPLPEVLLLALSPPPRIIEDYVLAAPPPPPPTAATTMVQQ